MLLFYAASAILCTNDVVGARLVLLWLFGTQRWIIQWLFKIHQGPFSLMRLILACCCLCSNRWRFMNKFFSGFSQWSFELRSSNQKNFEFCSKMPVGQPIFKPAIPKWPGKLQVLQAFLSKTKTCFVVGRPQSFIEKFQKNYLLIVT